MSTLKLKSFSVDIKRDFCVDLKNVDLNNYTPNPNLKFENASRRTMKSRVTTNIKLVIFL